MRSGKLLLRVNAGRAYWDGIDLNLTVTEFNIVHLMVMNADKHVTYRAIYDCVHHPGFVAGSGEDGYRTNVRSAMKRIRNKFRALDGQFCQIENFSAFGYRWCPRLPRSHRLSRLGRRIRASLTVKLVLLVGVFVALPVLLAGQFEGADRKMRDLVSRGIERQNALIAQALAAAARCARWAAGELEQKTGEIRRRLHVSEADVAPVRRCRRGRVLFRRRGAVDRRRAGQHRAQPARPRGRSRRVLPTCTWNTPAQVRHANPAASAKCSTSVIPIDERQGLLGAGIVAHDLGIPRYLDRRALLERAGYTSRGDDLRCDRESWRW